MDLQPLKSSRDADAPSGDNLEYDMDFIQLELAATPGEERQVGDEITPAEDPDWSEVEQKALAVLERSHDLRAAVHLAHAAIYTEGLQGFAEATGYIRAVLEEFWDTAHPQLDAEDDDDPTARINAVRNLAAAGTILRGLRRTPLAESRNFGRATLRDVQAAAGEIPGDDDSPDAGKITAAFHDTAPEVLASRLEAARAATANVKAIDGVFNDRLPGIGPDFDELNRVLRRIVNVLAEHSGDAGAADEAEAGGAAPAGTGGGVGAPMAGGGPPGAIGSLADVSAALDRIMAFYQRAEPSSPVPVLLARAKKLVGADFLTIMKNMAPQGLDNVRLIGGIEEEDDD